MTQTLTQLQVYSVEALYRGRLAGLLALRASSWGPIPFIAGALTSIVSERRFTTRQQWLRQA